MRFVLQCEGERCNKSPLTKSMKCFAVWNFQIKKNMHFGSKCNWCFDLIVILFIYGFSIHNSLEVKLTSSSALRAPVDSAQGLKHLLKTMLLIVYLSFLYTLVIWFTNGLHQAVTVMSMYVSVHIQIYVLKNL